jgi:hypothetical protein
MTTAALGTITFDDETDGQGPLFVTRVHFSGVASYAVGGSTGLQAALRAHFGDQRTIIGIIPQDCGGYLPYYTPATDKLGAYWYDPTAGAAAALPEVATTTDLHTVTFNLVVLSY